MPNTKFSHTSLIILLVLALTQVLLAQDSDSSSKNGSREASSASRDSVRFRLLQSNEVIVPNAYLTYESEFRHSISFFRVPGEGWSTAWGEEVTIGNERRHLSFSTAIYGFKKVDKVEFQFNYGLFGGETTRFAFSPGVGVAFSTSNSKFGMGKGAASVSFLLPFSALITRRLASNTTFQSTLTKSARNGDGGRANTKTHEFGQSFVWLAKPKLNFFVDTTWERSIKVVGPSLTEKENEVFFSPGARWAYIFKNGLAILPAIAVPIGAGPNYGQHGVLFSLAFEHTLRKEH